jgi:hypothetical protein
MTKDDIIKKFISGETLTITHHIRSVVYTLGDNRLTERQMRMFRERFKGQMKHTANFGGITQHYYKYQPNTNSQPILKGWQEGVLLDDIHGLNYTHKKGSIVRYKRYKTKPDDDRLTKYEWHYLDQNNANLIIATKRIIEDLPIIEEPFLKNK